MARNVEIKAWVDDPDALRARAAAEIHELLALCARLRTQVTVMRFAGTATEDVGELVCEILGRVEGVGAALDPTL